MPTFAAVDIGSNSCRLKIARLQAGRLRPLHEDREVTRLGEGVFGSGFLTPESMAETVKVLRRFHRATQQIVTDTVRVVATERSPRCPQFTGVSGMGALRNRMARGNHLWD
jgi:Exopolyphosphatase